MGGQLRLGSPAKPWKLYLVQKSESSFFICFAKKEGCHRSHPCGEWPCLLRTMWRGSELWGSAVSPAPWQNACSGCSHVGCRVLLRNAEHSDHQLGWKTSEGSHLFVTSYRTRSWLLCSSTLLFSRHQFKNLLWRFFHACLCQSLLRSCSYQQICPIFPLLLDFNGVTQANFMLLTWRIKRVSTLIPLQMAFSSL